MAPGRQIHLPQQPQESFFQRKAWPGVSDELNYGHRQKRRFLCVRKVCQFLTWISISALKLLLIKQLSYEAISFIFHSSGIRDVCNVLQSQAMSLRLKAGQWD